MGWKASMAIAQNASNVMAKHTERLANHHGRCMPYADNFLFGASTLTNFDHLRTAWATTRTEASLLTKNGNLRPNEEKDALGLHWHLREKTLRATTRVSVTLADALRLLKEATFREVFMMFGIANYARYMMDLPSFRYQNFMMWFRRASATLARDDTAWDRPAHLPHSATRSLRRMIRDIGKPRRVCDTARPHDAILYSDASDTGGGFIVCDPATQQLHDFPHIHQKEALALASGVKAAMEILPDGSKILAMVDNQVLDFNWRGRKSSDPIMATILHDLHNTLEARSFTLQTQWIPTHKNIADSLSRIFEKRPLQ